MPAATFRNRPAFWGVTFRQLAWLLAFYGAAVLLYDLALSISQRQWSRQSLAADVWVGLPPIGLDYALKLALTAPIWYVLFVRLRHRPLGQRVLLHLVALPLFVAAWQGAYYALSDAWGFGHLRGNGQVWDTYIGSLFYLVQFGVFHAYAYYRDLQRQREREAALRELALQSELAALKAQLNPHFLYNVFNTIAASVPPAQERTRELLAELADLFRYQLRATGRDTVPVQDELAFVRKYLDLEKARFGDRLQIRFAVQPEALALPMPPMLLQPLVENAVRHGIAPLVEGGEVQVSVGCRDGRLHCAVADTGAGLAGAPEAGATPGRAAGHGVGLANTRLRLEKMFGATLSFTPNRPRGLVVAFAIPIPLT